MLSDKAMRILKVLALNNRTMITVKMLGVCLDMSERSVSMYLKEVSEFCQTHQIAYISKRGAGVCLDLPDSDAEILKKFKEPSYYDVDYRVSYILQVLFAGWENYTVTLFADELYASKYVINSDLDLVEEWLGNYELTLLRKLKNGIAIEGKEQNLRCAMIAHSRTGQYPVRESGQDRKDWRLDCAAFDRLAACYGELLTGQISDAIKAFEELTGASLVDYSFVMLAEYLCLQCKRVGEGEFIPENELILPCPVHDSMGRVELFIRMLEDATGITFPLAEQAYASVLLAGTEFQRSGEEQKREIRLVSHDSIVAISHEILSYISEVTGLRLEEDQELVVCMEAFLHRCIVRTRYRLEICNPFLEEIKKNYGAIFTACFSLCGILKKECGRLPTEHEVAFMTLLIGGALVRAEKKVNAVLVGAGGLLLTQMLAQKIEQAVPGLCVIAVLSMDTISQLEQLQYDFVITTVPGHRLPMPAVCVTPVLGERDIINLQKALNKRYSEKLGTAESVSLSDYINPKFIMLDVEAGSKEKLIGMACAVLEQEHYVTEEYKKEILRREAISSTEVGNGVAIPHGIENTVCKPTVFMIRLKNKMDWGSDPVDIIFMLALNFNDITVTRRFFKLFNEKVGDRETAERLRRAKTKDDILEILK